MRNDGPDFTSSCRKCSSTNRLDIKAKGCSVVYPHTLDKEIGAIDRAVRVRFLLK